MMLSRTRYISLVVLSLWVAVAGWCAPLGELEGLGGEEPQFRRIGTAEGLPSNCVRDLAQDSTGYVWMATDGGLVRYDGLRFKPYSLLPTPTARQPRKNPYPERFAMAVTTRGDDIYAATDMHLYRYDRSADRFVYMPMTAKEIYEVEGLVRSLEVDHNGHLWASVASGGVWRMRPDGSQVKHYEFPDMATFSGNIFVDSRNRVWVTTNNSRGDLYLYQPSTDSFEAFTVRQADGSAVNTQALAMGESADGGLWLALWNGDLLRFDPNTGRATRITDTGAYHPHSLRVETTASGERLLIGSDAGLTILLPPLSGNGAPMASRTLTSEELNPASLSNRFVYAVLRDKEGGYWISTFHGGVNYLPPSTSKIVGYRPSHFRNAVGGTQISAIATDGDQRVYLGSEDAGVSYYDRSTGLFHPLVIAANAGAPRLDVHALAVEGDNLWIGTYNRGLWRVNLRTGASHQFLSAEGDERTLDSNDIYSLLHDSQGQLWVGTAKGLNRYIPSTESFARVRTLDASIPVIVEGPKGNLWLGTSGNGAFRYNPQSDVWKNFRFTDGSTLPHNHVNHLAFDAQGRLWAATSEGLAQFDFTRDDFRFIAPPHNTTRELCAIAPADSVLWISSAYGLVRYEPARQRAKTITEREGLASDHFQVSSVGVSTDGRIYFGSTNGFTAFNPQEVQSNAFVPPVVISAVEVDGQPYGAADTTLLQAVAQGRPLRLSHRDHSVTFQFASLSFINPLANRYRYRLEGFDKEWIEATGEAAATYTNLPAGRYTLQVQGSNNDGLWNPDTTELHIYVAPPWWLTWWMRTLYIMLALGLVATALWLVSRRATLKRRREISRLKAGREKEIADSKLQFFTIIAHEIRTPVSLIIGPLEKVMGVRTDMPSAVRHDMDIIDRNARRLLTLVNQLLDFKKAERSDLAIAFRPTAIVAQVQTVAVRFAPSIQQAGGALDTIYPAEDFTADVDPEALNKLVSNPLNNARKFTHDRVTLEVAVQPDKGTFTIAVTDNGCGIAPENLKKIFRPFYQVENSEQRDDTKGGTGLGLSIVRKVAEAHSGHVEVASELGLYTRFTATLPLRQAGAITPQTPAASQEPGSVPVDAADGPAIAVASAGEVATESETGKPRVLVVDDNPEMTAFLSEALADSYAVTCAADGREALDMLRQSADQPFSLIVSDWMMPRFNGLQLCQAVRADVNLSHIPLILLTAKTDNLSRIEGMDSGADYYIEKPFSTAFLRACIANLVRRRQTAAQRYASEPLEPVKSLASNPQDDRFMERLTALIEERLTDSELSVDILATQLGLSRSSFYAKIRSLANISPAQLIELQRLKRAAQLLRQGGYMVSEVATLVGYNSPSYFSTRFKAQFGLTPAAFAAQ